MNHRKQRIFCPLTCVLVYLVLYTAVSFLFLELFPWVHSDESWLAGLTRNMAQLGDFSATEAFFDAKPRYPHAVKLFFHLLQMLAISLGGYHIVSVRALSLVAAVLSLFFFYLTAKCLLKRPWTAFFLMVLFSLDIQFIYSSHMARQESLLLLSMTLCLYLFFRNSEPDRPRHGIITGIVTGLSVGLHPNSFLLACMLGCCYLVRLLQHPEGSKKPLGAYVTATGLFAALFVGISYLFDPQFLTHYIANGIDEFGIDAAPGSRLAALFGFFGRLFHREGGTYYVAEIKLQFLLFAAAALLLLCFFLVMRKETEAAEISQKIALLLAAEGGIIAGIFLIGRFSQLSIIFLFPVGWLLVALALTLFEPLLQKAAYAVLLTAVLCISIFCIRPYLSGETYGDYLAQVASFAAPDDVVIANLNTDFYFENGALHDYRNLPYVMQEHGSLDAYIKEHRVEYIFYSAELDYYYQHRPYYNALYGNIMFAGDLLRYCTEECEYIGSFENSRYAPRILELIHREEYATVKVFRTKYAK